MFRPLAALSLLTSLCAAQQTLPTPSLSPHARITQTVGVTEMSVDYHAPAVRNREIWGGKVPWGVVWRAGANANTLVEFSTDVLVEGQPLPAGAYGLHMIPGPERFTVIFSKDSKAWGSYAYRADNDALRVDVTPRAIDSRERMAFLFEDVGDDRATLTLAWERLAVPVQITVDLAEVVLGPVREAAARNDAAPGWQYWFQAAEFGRDHGVPAAETLGWIERSVAAQTTFTNKWAQSELLAEVGRAPEAEAAREAALKIVTVDELAGLGHRYTQRNDLAAAVTVYDMVIEMGAPNWWTYTEIAATKQKAGDLPGAEAAYKLALTKNPDPVTKAEIEASLAALRQPARG